MTRVRTAAGFLGAIAIAACGGNGATSGASGTHDPKEATPWEAAADEIGHGRGPSAIALDGGWDGGAPSGEYPAGHPDMPQVRHSGGRVLLAPRVVAVTFDGDPYRDAIDQFVTELGKAPYWAATTAEYGIGPVVAAPPGHVAATFASTIDDRAIQTWLRGKLLDPNGGLGPADEQTIYALYFPPGVRVSLEGYVSCDTFGGYHAELAVGDLDVAYAVIPRCASFADVHGFDVVTVASSHEIIEAATDPLPYSDPAYTEPDDAHAIWGAFTGGETGDMCTFNEGAFYKPADFPFMVQRSWSNAAAAAGHEPCVPALRGEVYFNSAPVLTDKVTLLGRETLGLRIPVHERAGVDVALYSDGPTDGPWEVSAQDLSEVLGGPPVLSFSFDRTRGSNGERLRMVIEVLAIDPQFGGEGFVITSELHGQRSYWYGFVQN